MFVFVRGTEKARILENSAKKSRWRRQRWFLPTRASTFVEKLFCKLGPFPTVVKLKLVYLAGLEAKLKSGGFALG